MAPALSAEVIRAPTAPSTPNGPQQPSIIESVVTLSKDPIPNIRFNVAKALEVLATVLSEQEGGKEVVQESILPALNTLKDDSDPDVRYFAGKAVEVRSLHSVPFLRTLTECEFLVFTDCWSDRSWPTSACKGRPIKWRSGNDRCIDGVLWTFFVFYTRMIRMPQI